MRDFEHLTLLKITLENSLCQEESENQEQSAEYICMTRKSYEKGEQGGREGFALLDKLMISPLDRQFAGLLLRGSSNPSKDLALAAALTIHSCGKGHSCINLRDFAGKPLDKELQAEKDAIFCPEIEQWLEVLAASGAVGQPGDFLPLILSSSRLYLHRYWEDETIVLDFIRKRCGANFAGIDTDHLNSLLAKMFPGGDGSDPDWQEIAVLSALCSNLCVITGGPGTGKTHIIARLLAMMIELNEARSNRPLRIRLAAPTGKAAHRMTESIEAAISDLPWDKNPAEFLPRESTTLHRLLGLGGKNGRFRKDALNPVAADVVIVDEASMVDLPLMARLMSALPVQCRLVLLGDRDQLASVEPGAVLADMSGGGLGRTYSTGFSDFAERATGHLFRPEVKVEDGGFHDSVVELRKNFRFSSHGGIHAAAAAVRAGDHEAFFDLCNTGNSGELKWRGNPAAASFRESLRPFVMKWFAPLLAARNAGEAFSLLGRFAILCGVRSGPRGVGFVNRHVAAILGELGVRGGLELFHGMPLMILKNDYGLELFNGDVGAIISSEEGGQVLKACFPGRKGKDKSLSPARLPEYQMSYAMTVHKSQGSEFERVLLILPDPESPVLTRELLYTALTRARKGVEIWGSHDAVRAAINNSIYRESGIEVGIQAGGAPGRF